MDLIEKYLGEGKIAPHIPYDPMNNPKHRSAKENKPLSPDELEDLAKMVKGKTGQITANVAWAMKKNDKKKVQKLVDMYPQHIMSIHDVMKWLRGK